MKKLLILSALLMAYLFNYAQISQISGTVKPGSSSYKEIALMQIEDGDVKVLSTTTLGEDGFFGFAFKPTHEGMYAVGSPELLRGQFPVYLKPGDNANLAIDKYSFVFTGQNTPENQVLGKWETLTNEVKRMSVYFNTTNSSYVNFFPELTKVADQRAAFQKEIKTKNQKFNAFMRQLTVFDLDFYAINLLKTPRTAHPAKEEYVPYYSTIVVPNKFATDDVLDILYGKRFMVMYGEFASPEKSTLDDQLKLLGTERQRGEYVLYYNGGGMRTFEKYQAMVDAYGKYMVTANQKKKLEELSAKLYSSKAGGEASDFSYPDKDGKVVSLSGQKGKVVLVDVWATWCGPCKKEIPSLKAMEKEMHDKNVVFMSVSVDEGKDKAKWQQMIKDEQLAGVQLFASGWSKIAKDYKITAIPRFMVFGKDGKVVTVDAPRPSDPKLKSLLEAELAK